MKKRLFFIVVLLVLVSCSTKQSTDKTPGATAVPPGRYDGIWSGTGSDVAAGRDFQISFSVSDSQIAAIRYSFNGTDGIPCSNIDYTSLTESNRPRIEGELLSVSLGEDLHTTIHFVSDENASGELTARWADRQPRCNGDYKVTWTATRQTPQGNVSSGQQNPNAPNGFETFIQILIFGLSNGAVLALNAIGVSLIYSTVRTLNLAHGDVFALTTALVTSLVNIIGITQQWAPLQLAAGLVFVLCMSMLLGAVLSMGVERFGFRPFRGSSRLAPLIATLGISFILYQGALVWRTFQHSWIPGEHRSVPGLPEVPTDGIPNLLPEINLVKALGLHFRFIVRFADVFVILMAVMFVILATWFLQKTRTGHALRALSQNAQAAEILGVNVNQTITRAFAIGGAFAGAAAFIFALYYGRPFGVHGAQSGLLAFAAALLGGIGSPVGALLSGLFMGVVSSLSDYYLSAQWTPVLLLALLILLLVWRPMGLAVSGDALTESVSARDSVILTAINHKSGWMRWQILLLVFAILPILFPAGQNILRIVGVFIMLTLALNLVLGIAGLLDFGFAASFGLGAYAAALLGRVDMSLVLLAGIAVGALLGAIKGLMARRLRGDFLAVATLTLGLLARQVIVNIPNLTGGVGGLGGFGPLHFLSLGLFSPTIKFYLVWIFVFLTAWVSVRLVESRTGRAWLASSEDEQASISVGVNVNRERLWAFMFSSALASLAGALYAGTFSYVDPETMSFHISSMVLAMVILGGAGDVSGAILGAAILVLYDKVIVSQIATWVALFWPKGWYIGATGAPPDIRGASFFNFGIALYLTVLWRARRKSG
jgi:branched-chain amino acid transport system permease protein